MKEVTLKIPEKKYKFFMELIKSLDFVKLDKGAEDLKEQQLESVKRGFEEMKLIKEGKLKTTSAKDFLDEL